MLLICKKCVVWLYCQVFLETKVFFLSMNVSRDRIHTFICLGDICMYL